MFSSVVQNWRFSSSETLPQQWESATYFNVLFLLEQQRRKVSVFAGPT
jgi:hypothetical protein